MLQFAWRQATVFRNTLFCLSTRLEERSCLQQLLGKAIVIDNDVLFGSPKTKPSVREKHHFLRNQWALILPTTSQTLQVERNKNLHTSLS